MPAEIKLSKKVGVLEAEPVRSAWRLFDHFFHPESVARESADEATDEDNDRLNIKCNIRFHSFADLGYSGKRKANVVASPYSFPGVILEAYQKELHLSLRPDDIWLAILVQLKYYINKNQEELRAKIVLGIPAERIRLPIQPRLAQRGPVVFGEIEMKALEDELKSLLKDFIKPDVKQWLLPTFSTTGRDERWAALITVQGTLSSYFLPPPTGHCGFPSVTLEGRKADWQHLLRCINGMGAADLGREIEEWSAYLEIVVTNMMAAFNAKFNRTVDQEEAIAAFWNSACDLGGTEEEGSIHTLGGWVTVFCWFQSDGARVPSYSPEEVDMLNAHDGDDRKNVELDGLPCPVIPSEDSIPAGYARLNMLCEWPTGRAGVSQLKEMDFLAGVVGMEVATKRAARRGFNVVQPRPGFWMLLTDVDDGKTENGTGQGSANNASAIAGVGANVRVNINTGASTNTSIIANAGEGAGSIAMSFEFSDVTDDEDEASSSAPIDPRLAGTGVRTGDTGPVNNVSREVLTSFNWQEQPRDGKILVKIPHRNE